MNDEIIWTDEEIAARMPNVPSYILAAQIRAKAKGVSVQKLLKDEKERLLKPRGQDCLDADEIENLMNGIPLTQDAEAHLESCIACCAIKESVGANKKL